MVSTHGRCPAAHQSLKFILSLCPDDVRVAAWVKPFCAFKPNVNPAYAWEPVIIKGGRKLGREVVTVRDWIAESITLNKGLCGVKPKAFCFWLFDFVGLQSGDVFYDIFPGSGAVGKAWQEYRRQMNFTLTPPRLSQESFRST